MQNHQTSIENKVNDSLKRGRNIYDALSALSQSELYSLLLLVCDKKSKQKSHSSILKQHKDSSFIKSSSISQLDFINIDQNCINIIGPSYTSIDLSPVAALWSNKITWTSQNKLLSTIRWLELVGDWCVQLAYHHASQSDVNIDKNYITSHRMVRNQNFWDSKYTNHFRMLCLGSHINNSNLLLHINKLFEHIEYIIMCIEELKNKGLIAYDNIIIEFANLSGYTNLTSDKKQEVINALQKENKEKRKNISFWVDWKEWYHDIIQKNDVWIAFEPIKYSLLQSELLHKPIEFYINEKRLAWIGHYTNYCYSISLCKDKYQTIIADWWVTNRTGTLLNNTKSAFVVSWVGTEILLKLFKS